MKKGIGDKVLGWFIVDEGAEASANAEEEASEVKPRFAPAAPPRLVPPPAVGSPNDASGFGAVYRAAGVEDGERERLGKVLSLVASLPEDAPIDVKRAIVGASLEAFGVSIDRILVTSEGALAALDGHVAAGQSRSKEVIARAESRIAALTAEIEEQRRLIGLQIATQQELARSVAAEKTRIQGVIAFFDRGDRGSLHERHRGLPSEG